MSELHSLEQRALARLMVRARGAESSREWMEFMYAHAAYCELSRQVERDGATADPESARLVIAAREFFDDVFGEMMESGELGPDLVPYDERVAK